MFKVGDKVVLTGTSCGIATVIGIHCRYREGVTIVDVRWSDDSDTSHYEQELSYAPAQDPLIEIRQSEYDNLIEEINMLQELVAELSKEKESEEFKPISEYTIFDWEKARTEGAVFLQRNGDSTTISTVDISPYASYPVESESGEWFGLDGKFNFDKEHDFDIVERIK